MDLNISIMLVMLFGTAFAYKPVIFMHGILAAGDESSGLFDVIKKLHPGTQTLSIDQYDKTESLVDMNTQVTAVGNHMMEFMEKFPDGVHLVCFSQGGLVCRAVLERFQHNIDTFVSLSSPQAGQFGDTDYVKYLFPYYLKDNLYKILYTSEGQKISVGNYWNDPHQQELYRNISVFLAPLNSDIPNPKSKENKANFLRLKKLVMIGGPDDGVITPWQSSHFGFYNDKEEILEMKDQKWYTQDLFGLKTLDARNALVTYVIPGVQHVHWHSNQTVLTQYILPHLT